ncbi:MAG: hypothetical protein AAFR61_09705 [Bacteroidota bacterium]
MRIFTFGLLFLGLASLQAQNAMFIPFGQSTGELSHFIQNLDYVQDIALRSQKDSIQVNLPGQDLTYHFHHNILYAISDLRYYENKREAERVIGSCLAFMELGEKKLHQVSNKGSLTHYACLEEDRVTELKVEVIKQGKRKKHYRVLLTATSRRHGPRMKTEAFASSLD